MSNGIGPNPLNPLSKIYLEQISEKKDDSYLEPVSYTHLTLPTIYSV